MILTIRSKINNHPADTYCNKIRDLDRPTLKFSLSFLKSEATKNKKKSKINALYIVQNPRDMKRRKKKWKKKRVMRQRSRYVLFKFHPLLTHLMRFEFPCFVWFYVFLHNQGQRYKPIASSYVLVLWREEFKTFDPCLKIRFIYCFLQFESIDRKVHYFKHIFNLLINIYMS